MLVIDGGGDRLWGVTVAAYLHQQRVLSSIDESADMPGCNKAWVNSVNDYHTWKWSIKASIHEA
jgi:hypothetical protein